MKDLSQKGYTHEEIVGVLHGRKGSREIAFRYDLLDKDENKIGVLNEVESASVEHSFLSSIKRTAKFTLREEYTTERKTRFRLLNEFPNLLRDW